METAHSISLVLHVIAGCIALFTGSIILFARKGGPFHRKMGRAFYFAMIAVGISAFILSVIRPSAFLFMVSAFSLYQVLSGYRDIRNKGLRPTVKDLLIFLLGVANAVAMFASGSVILLVFAGISTFLVIGDIRTYSVTMRGGSVPRLMWLSRHIGHMMGGYIATFTAFIVVTINSPELGFLLWLAPTAIGVPLIIYWTRKFVGRDRVTEDKALYV